MSEASLAKPASTQHKRLMRAVYTFFGCGLMCGFLLPLLVVGGIAISTLSPQLYWIEEWLEWMIEPSAEWAANLFFERGMPRGVTQTVLFIFGYCFTVGLACGLPVSLVVYFIKDKDHA